MVGMEEGICGTWNADVLILLGIRSCIMLGFFHQIAYIGMDGMMGVEV